MATPRDEYYTKILGTLIYHNNCHKEPLSSEELRQAVSRVMSETEEEECDAKCNTNNVTMDDFIQSPVTINAPRNKANVPNQRQITSGIMAEEIKVFK